MDKRVVVTTVPASTSRVRLRDSSEREEKEEKGDFTSLGLRSNESRHKL